MKTIIIFIAILVVVATIATIMIGTQTFEGIVVEKPYEAGLAWDAVIQNRKKLGWTITLGKADYRVGNNELVLNVRDRNGLPLPHADMSITISRPSTRAYDRTYPAVQQARGSYHVLVDLPLQGAWDMKTTVIAQNERSDFLDQIFAEKVQ